ncbi:hypothetical protein ElyMa_003934000 [Elysia marginata]|uniref:Uncharacterized protein n=1 Tax=Elysia marginata TaxID=1093978 RepID=A0AAV4FRE2_9GAST|nr:hypothetical protein ElyMa_003934000 [Elysia marginata]
MCIWVWACWCAFGDTEDFPIPETHQLLQYSQPHAEPRSSLPTRSPRATQARPRLANSYSPHSSKQDQSPHSPSPTSPTLVEQSNSLKRVMQPLRSYSPTERQTCPYYTTITRSGRAEKPPNKYTV